MYIKTREVHNGDTDTGEDNVLFRIPVDNTLCVHMFIIVYIAICQFPTIYTILTEMCLYSIWQLPVTCFSNNMYNLPEL